MASVSDLQGVPTCGALFLQALEVEGCASFWPYPLCSIWSLLVIACNIQLYWYGAHLASPFK